MSRKLKVWLARAHMIIKIVVLLSLAVLISMTTVHVGFLLHNHLSSGRLLVDDGFKIGDLIDAVLVVLSLGLAYWGFKIARDAAMIAEKANDLASSEAEANRQHNKHSVAPLLDLWCQLYPSDAGKLEISVANNGMGPAIVEKLVMKKEQQIVFDSSRESSKEWSNDLKKFFGVAGVEFRNDSYNIFRTNLLEKGAVIQAGNGQDLVEMYVFGTDFNAEESTSDLEVEVIYKSIYGEVFHLEKIF